MKLTLLKARAMLLKLKQTQEVRGETPKILPQKRISCYSRHQRDDRQCLFLWLFLLFYRPHPKGTSSRVVVEFQSSRQERHGVPPRGTVPF